MCDDPLNEINDEKQKCKRNLQIFAERSEKLTPEDKQKFVLEQICEEDEELRMQIRTSNLNKKIYYIAKKSNGAANPALGLIQ